MLRLDPGEGRIRTTRSFRVWEGGGEYNVARGLRRASACAPRSSPRSRTTRSGGWSRTCILTGGVDTVVRPLGPVRRRRPVGPQRAQLHRARLRRARRGRRVATAGTPPPRSSTPGDVDWEHLFGELGVRWFHTGGIFAALSETARRDGRSRPSTAARKHGTVVSLRPQLPAEPLEGRRRPGPRAGGQPRDRAARRRDDRQRGGLHRLRSASRSRASTRASSEPRARRRSRR